VDRPTHIDNTCATPGCDAPRDAALTLRLLVALPALALAMKLFGFRRTYAALGKASARHVAAARDAASEPTQHTTPVKTERRRRSPQHVADVVVHVNRHVLPYQSKCLLESCALWYLLRRDGYPAELLLGARTLLGPLEAHAWVELAGTVLNDAANVRDIYEPFDVSALTAKPESP